MRLVGFSIFTLTLTFTTPESPRSRSLTGCARLSLERLPDDVPALKGLVVELVQALTAQISWLYDAPLSYGLDLLESDPCR